MDLALDYPAAKERVRKLVLTTLICIAMCSALLWIYMEPGNSAKDPAILFGAVMLGIPAGVIVRLIIGIFRFAIGY